MSFLILADVCFSDPGIRSLCYAANLAAALRTQAFFRIPRGEDATRLSEGIRTYCGNDICDTGRIMYGGPDFGEPPAGCEMIYVTHLLLEAARERMPRRAHLLLCKGEDGARRPLNLRRICVPFGDREAGLCAASLAFPFAKLVFAEVYAVHTTYLRPNLPLFASPDAHMNDEARLVQEAFRTRAAEAHVPLSVLIGAAPAIVPFTIEQAANIGCGLIVVAPGSAVYGGNADLLAKQSHIPVLVSNSFSWRTRS